MSLIHGSRGLIFFVHQFKPAFREAALLDDPVMLAAVSALNRQITELAPVLNCPTAPEAVTVESENPDVPVDAMVKQYGGSAYLFAVGMRDGATMTTFTLKGIEDGKTVEVIGEGRSLAIKAGSFNDTFGPWDVHLYRLKSEAIH
jgi:hypothetical protein